MVKGKPSAYTNHEVIDLDADEIVPVSPRRNHASSRSGASEDVDDEELATPFVDIHELFDMYNRKHFGAQITNTYVEYSTRMTLCAGTCTFKGPLGGCRIALSEPLLKFRPRSDLLSTLLHEMIHALLFITEGVAARDGEDGHGPKFMAHAQRINLAEQGTVNITPYHSFADEVDIYRVHHWQCNKCPMLIKRAMNRAPASRDQFWQGHEQTCGGMFVKVKEPEPKPPKTSRAPKNRAVAVSPSAKGEKKFPSNVMRTHRIDEMISKKPRTKPPLMMPCPVCNVEVAKAQINEHVNACLPPDFFSQGEVAAKTKQVVSEEREVVEFDANKRTNNKERKRTSVEDAGEKLSLVGELDVIGADVGAHDHTWKRKGASSERDAEKMSMALEQDTFTTDVNARHGKRHKRMRTENPSKKSREINPFAQARRTPARGVVLQNSDSPDTPKAREAALMVMIGNHDKLIDLAIDPLGVDASSMSDICPTVQTSLFNFARDGKESNIAAILEPLIRPESAYEAQERARKCMELWAHPGEKKLEPSQQPLANRPDINEQTSFPLNRAIEMRQDGGLVLADESGDVFAKARASRESVSSITAPSFPNLSRMPNAENGCDVEKVALKERKCNRTVTQKEAEDQPVTRPTDSRGNPDLRADGNESASKGSELSRQQSEMGRCPLCDVSVARSQLEKHVESCLNGEDVAPLIFDDLGSEHVADLPIETRRVRIAMPQSTSDGQSEPTSKCPLCDTTLARAKLDEHLTICMISTGVADAF